MSKSLSIGASKDQVDLRARHNNARVSSCTGRMETGGLPKRCVRLGGAFFTVAVESLMPPLGAGVRMPHSSTNLLDWVRDI